MTEEPKRRGRPPGAQTRILSTEEPAEAPVPENPTELQEKALSGNARREETSVASAPEVPAGWLPIIDAPKDRRITVSETGRDQTAVYWRLRRVVDRKNLCYRPHAAWTDFYTRLDIDFEPKFYKPYTAAEYVPIPRAK